MAKTKEAQNQAPKEKDIRPYKSIPAELHKEIMTYLSKQPYVEVAGMMSRLGAAITTNLEVIPDEES